MSPAAAALVAAGLFGALDLVLPLRPGPPGWRRLLRGAAAGVLAVGAREADAPVLLGLALFLAAVADAADTDRPAEFAPAELAVRVTALLVTAALLFELGGLTLLRAEPWRGLAGALVLAGGAALAWRRPALRTGPVGVLAPLPVIAASALALGAASLPVHLVATAAAGALLTLATAVELALRSGPVSRAERAVRLAAAVLLAWPALRP